MTRVEDVSGHIDTTSSLASMATLAIGNAATEHEQFSCTHSEMRKNTWPVLWKPLGPFDDLKLVYLPILLELKGDVAALCEQLTAKIVAELKTLGQLAPDEPAVV